MGVSLANVLREVQLEAGRVYRCQVGDLQVEIRVEKQIPDLLPDGLQELDVMLDPWTDLPTPESTTVLQAEVAHLLLLPDVPQIPVD